MKPWFGRIYEKANPQPPSGGCVLKPRFEFAALLFAKPAAFGRLCVETTI